MSTPKVVWGASGSSVSSDCSLTTRLPALRPKLRIMRMRSRRTTGSSSESDPEATSAATAFFAASSLLMSFCSCSRTFFPSAVPKLCERRRASLSSNSSPLVPSKVVEVVSTRAFGTLKPSSSRCADSAASDANKSSFTAASCSALRSASRLASSLAQNSSRCFFSSSCCCCQLLCRAAVLAWALLLLVGFHSFFELSKDPARANTLPLARPMLRTRRASSRRRASSSSSSDSLAATANPTCFGTVLASSSPSPSPSCLAFSSISLSFFSRSRRSRSRRSSVSFRS
mmetsp:Transcript_18889/g.48035  ORF Transcript_18889/g.48035 Transcript_18889/m.48035 type:complete len:286 (-) Transcript_18889:344-1201(-)